MTRRSLIASVLVPWILVGTAVAAQDTAPAPPTKQQADRPAIYDDDADHRALIDEALVRAKKENRRVLIQWGGNWCGWCIKLHALCEKDRTIARKLMYEYDVVLVPIDWKELNLDLAEAYGADVKKHGVPLLTVLDADGEVLVHQETGSLEDPDAEAGLGHDPQKVLAFLEAQQAPYLAASAVLERGLAEAKESDRHVFLHFGAPWCGWCRRLEAWMGQESVAKILDRDFVDVKIDLDRMVGAKDVFERYNTSGGGGIPWYVLLDAEGKPIVTSDAGGGNIGCPWTDEEVDRFTAFLSKGATRLTKTDMETLTKSLVAYREASKKK